MLTTAQISEIFRMGTLNGKHIDRSIATTTHNTNASYTQLTVFINNIQYQITRTFPYKENKTQEIKVYYEIEPLTVTPGTVHEIAALLLPSDHIDHHASDLYIKVTAQSKKIIERLQPKSLLSKFIDNIERVYWYDLPFCYNPTVKTEV